MPQAEVNFVWVATFSYGTTKPIEFAKDPKWFVVSVADGKAAVKDMWAPLENIASQHLFAYPKLASLTGTPYLRWDGWPYVELGPFTIEIKAPELNCVPVCPLPCPPATGESPKQDRNNATLPPPNAEQRTPEFLPPP